MPPISLPLHSSVLTTFLLCTYSHQIPETIPLSPIYFTAKIETYSYRKLYFHRLYDPWGISSTITSWPPGLVWALSQCLLNEFSATEGNNCSVKAHPTSPHPSTHCSAGLKLLWFSKTAYQPAWLVGMMVLQIHLSLMAQFDQLSSIIGKTSPSPLVWLPSSNQPSVSALTLIALRT